MKKEDWISVNEKLPEDEGRKYGKEVLVFVEHNYTGQRVSHREVNFAKFKEGTFYAGWVSPDTTYPRHGQTITHWQEIVKPKIKRKNN